MRQVLLKGWKGLLGGCGCVLMGALCAGRDIRILLFPLASLLMCSQHLRTIPFHLKPASCEGKSISQYYHITPPPPPTPTNLLPQAHTSPSLHLPLSMHLCPECRWNYHSVETSAKSRLLHPFPCSRSGLGSDKEGARNPSSPATGHENRLSLGTSQSLALTLSSRPPGVKHNRLRATRSVRHWDTLNLPGLSTSRLHDWENLCLPEIFAPGYRVNPSPLSF